MYILHTVGMYIVGVRMRAEASEGFPARSTVRASELRSRLGAAERRRQRSSLHREGEGSHGV